MDKKGFTSKSHIYSDITIIATILKDYNDSERIDIYAVSLKNQWHIMYANIYKPTL